MSVIKYPEAVKFYKKKSELQVKLAKPEADEAGRIVKKGCVFFEIANAIPGSEEGRIDWSNKIIMKIGTNDIASILHGLRTRAPEIKLFHSNDAGSTTCTIKPGNEGSFGLQIFKTAGAEKKNASLYLSGPDMVVLSSLLDAALPVTLGWA
ncbi:MAG: hypothetical protein PHY47_01080 [Lachnospiraceae bacterium]|nr:hypothetical protein [Lachnospiraceae bacterium]